MGGIIRSSRFLLQQGLRSFLQSAKVTRIFNRCHAHGLIAKIPHARRWRLTKQGRIAMTASVQLRDVQFPITHMKLTA